jgi:hypothetical protein
MVDQDRESGSVPRETAPPTAQRPRQSRRRLWLSLLIAVTFSLASGGPARSARGTTTASKSPTLINLCLLVVLPQPIGRGYQYVPV